VKFVVRRIFVKVCFLLIGGGKVVSDSKLTGHVQMGGQITLLIGWVVEATKIGSKK